MNEKKKTPLKITCTSSDCASNLHCFKATAEMKKRPERLRKVAWSHTTPYLVLFFPVYATKKSLLVGGF